MYKRQHASWANGGYSFDWAQGKNNMNEEWFGITAMGEPDADGMFTVQPRLAYHVLSRIWLLDPYTMPKRARNKAFGKITMDLPTDLGESPSQTQP